MKTNCVFAGTFDPFTVGHKQIVQTCLQKYDKVFIVIGENPQKTCVMTLQQRQRAILSCFENNQRVIVLPYSDIKNNYADYLKSQGVTVYVRGIRNQQDLEFEKQMEQKNKVLYPFITTEYLFAQKQFEGVSSSLVKQKLLSGENALKFIPKECVEQVKQAFADYKKDN
jgi:pantetheine-phosphate adenylyltransferase